MMRVIAQSLAFLAIWGRWMIKLLLMIMKLENNVLIRIGLD